MLTLTKKNNILKIFAIVFVLILLIHTSSFAIVSPTNEFYVNDYANLLNTETKEYIINTNKNLNSQTGVQIVVVTVPSLEGESLEEYATELFRNFGIGDKTKNNGVLLLLALEERQFRVEVGYGLEGALPDGKTGRIQDEYIIPYLKQDNWNEGIRNGYSAILQVVAEEYGVEVGAEEAISNEEPNVVIEMIPVVMSICMIFIIIALINRGGPGGRGNRRRGFYTGIGYGGFSGRGGSFGRRWIRRRRLFWRRRFFWWRRKLERLLK